MNEETKQYFIRNKLIPEDQFHFVEKQAGSSGVSVEKTIVLMNIMRAPELGRSLSMACRIPYIALKERSFPASARGAISQECVKRWRVLPVDFDPRISLLTFAISSPEQAEKLERIFSFLMESHDLAFRIAPEFELEEAIEEQIKQAVESAVTGAETPATPDGTTGAGPAPGKAEKRKLVLPSLQKVVDEKKASVKTPEKKPERTGRPQESRREEFTGDLLGPLTSAVSLMVTANIGNDVERMAKIRTRVRYCQLTATRLNLSPSQTTKIVMAAWLSALDDRRDVVRQFVNPFDLEAMVFSNDTDRKQDMESLVFSLVRCYQAFEQESPSEAKDVSLVRRGLHVRWPAAAERQDVLETFLQVLMDEQFLDKLGSNAGTIILVDHSASVVSIVEPALRRAGHEVRISSAAAEVRQMTGDSSPVLLIVNAESSAKEMLDLCRQLKTSPETSGIPLMAIVSANSDIRGAEFLRAGADDFLTLPVDIELLYLKVEKLVTSLSRQAATKGVTGSLADMSFCDLIQVLSAGGKSVEVVVRTDAGNGRLFLKQGNVIHAQVGSITGEQAFYQLMQWHEGEFSMRDCTEFPAATITSSTMSLLMEGARIVDEGTKAADRTEDARVVEEGSRAAEHD